jgi:hypothetical protein
MDIAEVREARREAEKKIAEAVDTEVQRLVRATGLHVIRLDIGLISYSSNGELVTSCVDTVRLELERI